MNNATKTGNGENLGAATLKANIRIVRDDPEVLVIRDVGPWDQFKTVTNDAEGVIRYLSQHGILTPQQRLLCYDSNGDLDELAGWNVCKVCSNSR